MRKFRYHQSVTGFQKEESLNLTNGLDLVTFGQRLRHLRKVRGYTLSDLGERVGRAPSQLSLLENGRVAGTYLKQRLPNYQVFDEKRYFSPL